MSRALLLVVALGASAHADVWQRAVDGKSIDRAGYDEAIARGDEAAMAANSRSISLAQVRKDLDTAIEHYRTAIKANPRSAEPHFRIGSLLHAFFFDCDNFLVATPAPPTCTQTPPAARDDKAREIVAAWDAFEKLAPLDPRVKETLLERAILRTKLVAANPSDKTLLQGALADYKALVEHADGLNRKTSYLVLGNLAETHMMLGQLDEAIEAYKDALRSGGTTSTYYGFAVALDRDESGSTALGIIRDQGVDAYRKFEGEYYDGQVFYVPAGEEQYYFALAEEAFGNYDKAIAHWKAFIQSGAHPQYQPRAKEHLDQLLSKKNLRWRPPLSRDPLRGM